MSHVQINNGSWDVAATLSDPLARQKHTLKVALMWNLWEIISLTNQDLSQSHQLMERDSDQQRFTVRLEPNIKPAIIISGRRPVITPTPECSFSWCTRDSYCANNCVPCSKAEPRLIEIPVMIQFTIFCPLHQLPSRINRVNGRKP